jgi:hypothetical protein
MAKKTDETAAVAAAIPAAAPAGVSQNPTIEEHAKTLDVPGWQLEGLKRLKRWGDGKRVPFAEFAGELNRWLNGRMDQRRARG